MPLKANRKWALSLADKNQGRWRKVDTLDYEENAVREGWLEGVACPLRLARQVFENEDGSEGIRYLVASDPTLTSARLTGLYPQTLEGRGVSQEPQAECRGRQVPGQDRGHPEPPPALLPPCLRQAGTAPARRSHEPLRPPRQESIKRA